MAISSVSFFSTDGIIVRSKLPHFSWQQRRSLMKGHISWRDLFCSCE